MKARLQALAILALVLALWAAAWGAWYRAAAGTPKIRLPMAGVPIHR